MFLEDVSELMIYTVPGAIAVVLWKIFVTNRTDPGVLILGLDEASIPSAAVPKTRLSTWKVLLYILTALATFQLGLLAFDAVQALS